MTQALTDGDGRVRDLLERPLVAGDYRLEFDVGREDDAFFRGSRVDLRIADNDAELPRPAAARAVLDDDVPGQLMERRRRGARRAAPRPRSSRPRRRGSRARRGSSLGSPPRARSATPTTLFARARRDRRVDAGGRAGRADRRPSAARRAAGVGVGRFVPRAGLRPRDDRGDRRPGAARTRAYEARFGFRFCVFVDGRSRAGARAGARGGARRRTRRRDPAGASTTSSRSPATGSAKAGAAGRGSRAT